MSTNDFIIDQNEYINEKNIRVIFYIFQDISKNAINFFKKEPIKKYLEKRKKICDDIELDIKNENKFCLFEVISNKYFRETFHSDIIAMLLNPNTREIGDIQFFNIFLRYLDIHEEATDVLVYTEEFTGNINGKKGYMDITCYYKTPETNEYDKAILIENKINYAPDMEDQLVRYMKCIKDKEKPKIKELTVVYLTLKDDKDAPDPSSYNSDKYDTEIQELQMNNSLKCISAVVDTIDAKSLVTGFLGVCLNYVKNKNTENNDLIKVFIEQYIILLNHLGGDAYMAKTNKDVIKAIYKDEDLFDTMESLVQLWADRELYVKKLLMENVDNNADFKDHENKKIEYWSVYAWPTKINDDLFIYIYDGCNFGFATNSNRAITESEIIDFVPKDMVFRSAKKIERQDSEKHWFYWRIDLKSKTVIEDTIKNLKTLLELAGK